MGRTGIIITALSGYMSTLIYDSSPLQLILKCSDISLHSCEHWIRWEIWPKIWPDERTHRWGICVLSVSVVFQLSCFCSNLNDILQWPFLAHVDRWLTVSKDKQRYHNRPTYSLKEVWALTWKCNKLRICLIRPHAETFGFRHCYYNY